MPPAGSALIPPARRSPACIPPVDHPWGGTDQTYISGQDGATGSFRAGADWLRCSPMARVLVTRALPTAGLEVLTRAGHEIGAGARGRSFPPTSSSSRRPSSTGSCACCSIPSTRAVLEAGAAGRLRVVGTVAVGHDNIDVAAAQRARDRGVQHARRARRHDRRSGLPPDPRGGAARVGGRSRRPRRALGGRPLRHVLRRRRARRGPRCGRVRPHRPGRGAARRGLRHGSDPSHAPRHRHHRAGRPISTRCSRGPTSSACTCRSPTRRGC